MVENMGHSTLVLQQWDRLMQIFEQGDSEDVIIDGKSLDLAAIVAVAR